MKKPWIYLSNPFLVATSNSYRKALRISTYHDGALNAAKADPFILPLYNIYHPLHLAYQDAYNLWGSKTNQQQGSTLSLEQLMDQLASTKIKAWDIAIQNVYSDTTPQYKSILPNRRAPFQRGSQNDRLSQVKALSLALTGIVALAAVKTDVDNFFTAFNTTLTTQKGSISSTKTNSDAVETVRIVMSNAQYADLGAFIQKYPSNPSLADQYFDLSVIRSTSQEVFTGQLNPLEAHLVAKHTFKTDDELTLDNPGSTKLQFWLSVSKNGELSTTVVTLEAGQTKTLPATDFGPLENKFIFVQNLSSSGEGEFEVDL